MSYDKQKFEEECAAFEAKYGLKKYVGKPVELPNWMKPGAN